MPIHIHETIMRASLGKEGKEPPPENQGSSQGHNTGTDTGLDHRIQKQLWRKLKARDER